MKRSEVFLQEMGVGAQWRLRNRAPQELEGGLDYIDGAPADELLAPASAPQSAEAPAPSAQDWIDAHAAHDAPPAHAAAPARPAPAMQPPAPRMAGGAAQSGHAAPHAQPAPAAPVPPAQRPAAGGGDTAWFDEAPVAAARPAQPAAPGRPAAPPAPQRPTAAQAAQQAGQNGAGEGESTAWFDDVPAMEAALQPAPVSADAGEAAGIGQDIADMDWPALQAAISACTRCELCQSRVAAVPGRGDPQAQWLVVGTAPAAVDEQEVRSIGGEPGQLLDNMLKAISLAPDEDAYVTTLVKCRPPADESGADRLPTADELAACRPYLARELELSGTRMILTLGHTAGKGLLGAAARGKVLRYDGIPTIATYHPADLLRKPADKAKAWSDLCLAKAAHAGRA